MDFTPELTGFQGILISVDNVYSFSKLTARGGNETNIDNAIKTLHNFLEREHYIDKKGVNQEKECNLRKLSLYLLLNADINALEGMVDLEGIHGVIWTVPTLPKCLLSEMLWNLHMDKFVFEAIAFSYPYFALEIASALIENIKYCTPATSLDRIRIISGSCYQMISRLRFYNIENDHLSKLLNDAINSITKCIGYYTTPPNEQKLNNLSKDDTYKHIGHNLHSMLTLINGCMEKFTKPQKFTPEDFCDIYLLTFKLETLAAKDKHIVAQDVSDCQDKCHMLLLDKCMELVMGVSVDIYCAWSEFEEGGTSMQQTIGELCYKVRTTLKSISSLSEHPVVDMFQQISYKPVVAQDFVNECDRDTLINNITNLNKQEWIPALLHRTNLFQDSTLLQLLSCHIECLTEEESFELFKICQSHVETSAENRADVEVLAVRAFQKCNDSSKNIILKDRFKNNCFCNMIEDEQFYRSTTEIFNKLIKSDAPISEIMNVFIQNPEKVLWKIFCLASESSQQTEIMLKVMAMLEPYANHYYSHETEPCIIRIALDVMETLDSDEKQRNYVKFISGLKNCNIISGPKLLLLIIMPNMHKAMLQSDIKCINIQCKLLDEAYSLEDMKEYRAPMLAMLAQVMETVRWEINTFVPIGPSTLQLALQLQRDLYETYTLDIPEAESTWLKSKLRNLKPPNMFYFRKVWNIANDNYIEVVSQLRVSPDMSVGQLLPWMSRILISSTQNEWYYLWDNLSVLSEFLRMDIFLQTIVMLTETVQAIHDESTWGCILNCFTNFLHVIRYKFLAEPLENTKVEKMILTIGPILLTVNEGHLEEFSTALTPLFGYIVERKSDYSIDIQSLLFSTFESAPKLKDVFKKLFPSNTLE